jgi:hypothetical protein
MISLQATPHALKFGRFVGVDVSLVEIEVDTHRTALGEPGRDVNAMRSDAELPLAAVDVGGTGSLGAR